MRKSTLFFSALAIFTLCFFKTEAQNSFGEKWYKSGEFPSVTNLALSPDERVLALGGDTGIELLDASTGNFIKKLNFPSDNGSLIWSPDGKFIIASGGPVQFIDTANGNVFKTIPAFSSQPAKFSPSGKYFIAGTYIIDAKTWEIIESPLNYIGFYEVIPGDSTALIMHYEGNDTIQMVRFPSGEVIRTYPVVYRSLYKDGIAVSHAEIYLP